MIYLHRPKLENRSCQQSKVTEKKKERKIAKHEEKQKTDIGKKLDIFICFLLYILYHLD